MSITKQRTLDFMEFEWGTYIERFNRWSKEGQDKRLKQMGYESFRDMLAHILAWWDEGMEIIVGTAEGREVPRKKYDFDVFNAEAVAKYKPWDEREFLSHFEKTRQKTVDSFKSMKEAAFENRRVQAWIHGVIIHHAREHLVSLSRFLAMDTLENEWSTYIEDFNKLEAKTEFLQKQGYESFHDLLAHVIGWWEEGARIITGILKTPGFTWTEPEENAFNIELIGKYKSWSDDDLFKRYEDVRHAMIDLVDELPDEAFTNKDIEGWLAADVVEHYDEHSIG